MKPSLSFSPAFWVAVGLATLANFCRAEEAPALPALNTPSYVVDPSWPQGGSGGLGAVSGVAVDVDDSVWVFKRSKPYVVVFDAAGKLIRSWDASFVKPHQIRLSPDGHVWVTDYVGEVVQKYTREGKLLLSLGTPGKQGQDGKHFYLPTDVAVDPGSGDIFVSDGYGNARIARFDASGKYLSEFGHHGAEPGAMNLPHSLVMDSTGNLYEADRDNGRLQIFDQGGKLLKVWEAMAPWGLWMTKSDELWICGTSAKPAHLKIWKSIPPRDQWVMRVKPSGEILGRWQFPRGKDDHCQPGELAWVHCIAVDSHQNLYLGDVRGNGLQKFVIQPKD